jgi:diaminopimelate decarboxylase
MWLTKEQADSFTLQHGSPLFVYSRQLLRDRAGELTALKLPYGHTVRYAMKANPHADIIRLFHDAGLHFDASSSYEAAELLDMGIPGDHISLSSQQPAHNLAELLEAGVRFVATSLHQLQLVTAAAKPGVHIALRVNPGLGSGHSNRTNTGGVVSSFGLWHEYLDEALELVKKHGLVIDRLHVHIGSGADATAWAQTIDTALRLAERMPDVVALDIGGGYKVARVEGETETDIQEIAGVFAEHLQAFGGRTGRQLHLEIEPGSWLVAHAGVLLAEIVDIVDTGKDGYTFLKLNTGMNDIIRPAMYGAQHTMAVLNDAAEQTEYVVVGHNCETGDILTPAPGDPEAILPRLLNKAAVGDIFAIADTGAYCAQFSTTGYNSYPSAKEIFV